MDRRLRLLVRLMPERMGSAISFMQEVEEAYSAAPDREVPSLARELDDAMLTIGAGMRGHGLTVLVGSMPQTWQILRRLVEEGVVVEETHRRLGSTTRRYRTTPSSGREAIVARIRSALLGESIPDDRTALLISSLVDVHPNVFVDRWQVREAYRRAAEILERIGEDERAIVHAVGEHMTNHDG